LPRRDLEQAVAQAEREGLVTFAELRNRIAAAHRRPGSALLREVLDLEGGPVFTRSEAERRLLELIRRGNLPRPEINARLGRFEVDFLWRAHGLAVEVDGYGYHRSRGSFEADRLRDGELAARGTHALRVTWRQIRDRPEALLVRLTRALEQAARRSRER
jgi:very-short-patch-repair endonuclease